MHYRPFVLIVLIGGFLTGCDTTGSGPESDAARTLIGGGLVKQLPAPGPFPSFAIEIGPNVAGHTDFVSTATTCEGAAGSVIPPLAFAQCTAGYVLAPLRAAADAVGAPAGRTLTLPGLERFWIHQKEANLCWAAAFETARGYLHLKYVPHTEMPKMVEQDCPKLRDQQRGASLYQIAYTILKINRTYDAGRLAPHTCDNDACIIQSISRGRPVILLRSSHAVLLQSVEIAGGTTDMIRRYWILDPLGNGKPEVKEPAEICTSDAIIAL
jgi:hypothetical protein